MRGAPDDGITSCVVCRCRLGDKSFRGYFVSTNGLALFRLCSACRGAADDPMLNRICEQAEQQLLLTGPAGGTA